MDLLNDYALGQDMGWVLLAVTVIGLVAIALGSIWPRRASAAQENESPETESPEVAGTDAAETPRDHRAGRFGSLLTSASATALLVGLPVAAALLLVPGSLDIRLLRSGMLLAGILAGIVSAWRGVGMLVRLEGRREEPRSLFARAGALGTASAIALGAVPLAIAVWFLQGAAGSTLIGFAAGGAMFALAVRAISALADTSATAGAVLGGADEHELGREAEGNPAAAGAQTADLFRRGPVRAAELTALTAALLALGIAIGVPVFAVEGILVPLLAAGIAILTALLSAVMPHLGGLGRERQSLRLSGVIPSVIGIGALAGAVLLWLPTVYKSLRFARVGLENFTDPNLTGGEAVPRAQLETQIEEAGAQMETAISQISGGTGGRSIIDTIAIYGVNPAAASAIALAVGALLALVVQSLMAYAADRRNSPALSAGRTSRTGGALGALGALGTAGSTTLLVTTVIAVALAGLGILGAGISMLTFCLAAQAGMGALVVAAGHGALGGASMMLDRPGEDEALRDASRTAETTADGSHLVALLLAGIAALAPITNALFGSAFAVTLWEDRALHEMSPASLLSLAGLALGIVTVLVIGTGMLESVRRLGATAVLDVRAALLQDATTLSGVRALGSDAAARRAAISPLLIAAAMPVAVGFGLGSAPLAAYVAGAMMAALVLAVWTTAAAATTASATDIIETGRFGGAGSWGHSGALGSLAMTGALRSTLGRLALPGALTTALMSAIVVGSAVTLATDSTSYHFRWLIALAAIVVIGFAWMLQSAIPEPDLEDAAEDLDAPLFARIDAEDEDDSALAAGWDDFAAGTELEGASEAQPGQRVRTKKTGSGQKSTGRKGKGQKGQNLKGRNQGGSTQA